jgi:hypothetical protein
LKMLSIPKMIGDVSGIRALSFCMEDFETSSFSSVS